MKTLHFYTDGGCRSNGDNNALGGWGVYCPELQLFHKGYAYDTTNNKMELKAVHQALQVAISDEFAGSDYEKIEILSDSSYVVNIFSNWIFTWIKTKTLDSKKNKEIIMEIQSMINILRLNDFVVKFTKVEGHSGDKGNELADTLVNEAMDKKEIIETRRWRIDIIDLIEHYLAKEDYVNKDYIFIYIHVVGRAEDKILEKLAINLTIIGFNTKVVYETK